MSCRKSPSSTHALAAVQAGKWNSWSRSSPEIGLLARTHSTACGAGRALGHLPPSLFGGALHNCGNSVCKSKVSLSQESKWREVNPVLSCSTWSRAGKPGVSEQTQLSSSKADKQHKAAPRQVPVSATMQGASGLPTTPWPSPQWSVTAGSTSAQHTGSQQADLMQETLVQGGNESTQEEAQHPGCSPSHREHSQDPSTAPTSKGEAHCALKAWSQHSCLPGSRK